MGDREDGTEGVDMPDCAQWSDASAETEDCRKTSEARKSADGARPALAGIARESPNGIVRKNISATVWLSSAEITGFTDGSQKSEKRNP
jgi:hypothetical protein